MSARFFDDPRWRQLMLESIDYGGGTKRRVGNIFLDFVQRLVPVVPGPVILARVSDRGTVILAAD